MNKVDWTKPIEMLIGFGGKWETVHYVGMRLNELVVVERAGSLYTFFKNGEHLNDPTFYKIRNKAETKEVQVDVGVFINAAGTVFPRLVCGGGGEGALRNIIAKTDEKLLHTFSAKIIVAK